MKALFVGGPWNGQVIEVKDEHHPIVAVSEVDLNDDIALNRTVTYALQRAVFFGLHLNMFISEDMRFNPHLEAAAGLMLLNPEYREVVA